jgi:hypothetical protein
LLLLALKALQAAQDEGVCHRLQHLSEPLAPPRSQLMAHKGRLLLLLVVVQLPQGLCLMLLLRGLLLVLRRPLHLLLQPRLPRPLLRQVLLRQVLVGRVMLLLLRRRRQVLLLQRQRQVLLRQVLVGRVHEGLRGPVAMHPTHAALLSLAGHEGLLPRGLSVLSPHAALTCRRFLTKGLVVLRIDRGMRTATRSYVVGGAEIRKVARGCP